MNDTTKTPWHRPRIRTIVEELFTKQLQWKTSNLVDSAYQIHLERNGKTTNTPAFTLRRVLSDLQKSGFIQSNGHGYWISNAEGSSESEAESASVPESDYTNSESNEPCFPVEKEIGKGNECVYIYFNPNDRKLAHSESKNVWECKVGRTSNPNVELRLISQGVNTALSRSPVLGLLIRTNNSALVEKILHDSLRFASSDYDEAIGREWFMTSPEFIETWYSIFELSISALLGNEDSPIEPGATG